jgi:hypothetical protein
MIGGDVQDLRLIYSVNGKPVTLPSYPEGSGFPGYILSHVARFQGSLADYSGFKV